MSEINTVLGDLGFAPDEEVINDDLVGELDYVLGVTKTPPKMTSPKTPPSKTLLPPSKTGDKALDKKVVDKAAADKVAADKKVTDKKAADDYKKATEDYNKKLAVSNKKVASAQAELRTSANAALLSARILKGKAQKLPGTPVSARTATRLSKMADRLTSGGARLVDLAGKKLAPKPPPKPSTKTSTKPVQKPVASKGKGVVGQIVEELFGSDPTPSSVTSSSAPSPGTTTPDATSPGTPPPITVTDAQAAVDAAQQAYNDAKDQEKSTVDDFASTRDSLQDNINDDSLQNDYNAAFQAALNASIARGGLGQALAAAQAVLAAMNNAPAPPPPPSDTSTPPSSNTSAPPPSDTGTSTTPDASTAPSTDSSTPPQPEVLPPADPGAALPDRAVPSGFVDPGYGPPGSPGDPFADPSAFADPFAGVPANVERTDRGGGGWDNSVDDQGGDPDFDVKAVEAVQDKVYKSEARSTKRKKGFPDELPVVEDTGEAEVVQGVVGDYLCGTSVLVGGVW